MHASPETERTGGHIIRVIKDILILGRVAPVISFGVQLHIFRTNSSTNHGEYRMNL
jgi:hypothetical protein